MICHNCLIKKNIMKFYCKAICILLALVSVWGAPSCKRSVFIPETPVNPEPPDDPGVYEEGFYVTVKGAGMFTGEDWDNAMSAQNLKDLLLADANGNFSATSNDGNIKVVANPVEDTEKEQPKELSYTAWGNRIVIDENGIKITDKNNNDISATSDGLTITDSNENVIQTSSTGISITDLNDNTIVTSKNGSGKCLVTINGHLTVKAGS